MADSNELVEAYSKRTGKKLPNLVPRRFVEELSDVTGLSASPRGKKAEAKTAEASTDSTKEK